MLSPGVETWRKSLLKVGFARKEESFSDFQDQTPQSLASGPDAMGLGIWPRSRRQGLRRLAPWPPQKLLLHRPKAPWALPLGRTISSYISIFISGPFQSSSSCL